MSNKAGKYKNFAGRKFHRRTITKFFDQKTYSCGATTTRWEYVCDCGKTGIATIQQIQKFKSCGCAGTEYRSLRMKGINTKSNGIAAKNSIYNSYVQRSRKKKIQFAIAKEEFYELIGSNCHYCGCSPRNTTDTLGQKTMNGHINYNGLDRVNNNLGYTLDNIVTCCEICNKAKRDLTYTEFMEWIQQIAWFQQS